MANGPVARHSHGEETPWRHGGLRREPWDTPRSNKLALWMRAGLLALAVPQEMVGAWAMFAPGSFHVDFPLPGWRWISTLPIMLLAMMRGGRWQ